MRWLCISDIHGDADALSAVLAQAERRGFDKVLVAGDLCFPGPQPLAVWRRLASLPMTCVQGLSDQAIATLDPSKVKASTPEEKARVERLAAVRAELGDLILARLARLEPTARLPLPDGGELVLVHGSPKDPTEPITHDMSDEEVDALLGDDPADVVVCGGSHVPFDRTVLGVRVINVGSVGEAVYQGERFADAAILSMERSASGWGELMVEPLLVPLAPSTTKALGAPTET
ncbi:MAG: metallophosphoesterase family protein [Polyangiaceae bacterium]